MKARMIALVALLGLAACEQPQTATDSLAFTQHKSTGLCFAVYIGDNSHTNVPCTPEVLAIINGQATAPPVTATETVR